MDHEGKKYDLIADQFDHERCRLLREKNYLDYIINQLPHDAHILDVGCGMGEPIAQYFIEKGYTLTGIDASEKLLALARQRFPQMEWLFGDMREIILTVQYNAIIAFDSFFHLVIDDQLKMIERFAVWLIHGGKLLITTGPEEGEKIGQQMYGQLFSYYSMSVENYTECFDDNGLDILLSEEDQPGHRVWIVQKGQKQ